MRHVLDYLKPLVFMLAGLAMPGVVAPAVQQPAVVNGRVERIASPLVLQTGAAQQRLTSAEEVLGYRLTPELTLRTGHRARRGFGRPGFDHQVAVFVVWRRRWI